MDFNWPGGVGGAGPLAQMPDIAPLFGFGFFVSAFIQHSPPTNVNALQSGSAPQSSQHAATSFAPVLDCLSWLKKSTPFTQFAAEQLLDGGEGVGAGAIPKRARIPSNGVET